MLDTIRRYWIGSLVLVLVILHASIVGIIRYQASMAKMDISCEVALGEFVAYRSKLERPVEMTLHAIVPQNHRMKSRQLIELNQAQVRQSLEEHLRQFDSRLLADPYLTDLRSQLLEILTQTLGQTAIEDVVVTQIHPAAHDAGLEFLSSHPRPEPRKLVATLRAESESDTEPANQEHAEESSAHQDPPSETTDAADDSDTVHAAPRSGSHH